ncbi:CgeB family protein [Oleiharenicola sp. Vm1]|uniref:CgeB family protein n=1 Tax=Oleiharenicola sp. Vm1 TaxID=3398393 RepID=UPI0039F5E4AD
MILAHVTTLYPGYVADFERRHTGLSALGYAEHYERLVRDAFGWSNHLTRHLAARGHVTAHFVANYAALQAKWLQENGAASKQDPLHIVAEQLHRTRPEVLFVDDCYLFSPVRVQALCAELPSLRLVVCHQGLDGDPRQFFPDDALVLSPAGHQVATWRAAGVDAHQFRHAFEPAVREGLETHGPRTPVSFLGSCSPLLHPERHRWLAALARQMPLEIWTDSFAAVRPRLLVGSLRRGRARQVVEHFFSPLRRRTHGPLYGRAMFAQLARSDITLNCHIAMAQPSAGNMRLFEATGAGACLVTDARRDLDEIFALDSEVVTYGSIEECVERVRWLLDHASAAAEIGARGQRRTLAAHTFAHRAAELEGLIEARLKAGTGGR